VQSGADRVISLCDAPFASGRQLVAVVIDDGGAAQKVAQIVSVGSATDRGATNKPAENLTFYRDKVVICDDAGAAVPELYGGASNSTDLTGSPPNGSRSCAYKDHLVLARSSANLERVWFAAPGDMTSWDTTNGYLDMNGEVCAMYPLRNAIIVFHDRAIERIVGSVPPPGTDMSIQPIFPVGLSVNDARSIAGTDDFVCFSNASGVFLTDGAGVVDLTQKGGMKKYWQDQCATATTLRLSGGYFRGYYMVTIRDGNATFVDSFLIHVESRRWMRLGNITAACFTRVVSGKDELYFGDFSEARVNALSGIFSPASGIKNDGDSTAVTTTIETPYYQTGKSKANFRFVYIVYDIRDAASDNPIYTLAFVTDPTSTSYTNVTDVSGSSQTLAETTAMTKARRRVGVDSLGIGFRLTQSNAAASEALYRIEVEADPLDDLNVR
jgi:hypothetical protein